MRKYLFTTLFVFVLTVTAFAGDVPMPGETPPPDPSMTVALFVQTVAPLLP